MNMKKTGMTMILILAAALGLWAQDARKVFDLFGGEPYGEGLTFTITESGGLLVSGKTPEEKTAGYVIEAKGDPLEFSRTKRMILRVSGLAGKDHFELGKLCKLELNNSPQKSVTASLVNRNDSAFLNARNGEAVFDLSKLRDIRKFNLVFFRCELENLKIEVFYE